MADVILVDQKDRETGREEKQAAHVRGLLHRAFSVFLTDGTKMLIQQRAPEKYHCGGLWSNACCSHPQPGERTAEAARRRLREELGIEGVSLTELYSFCYRAEFSNGLTEYELDHVFWGSYSGEVRPDPEEIGGVRWVECEELLKDFCRQPELYTPWFKMAGPRVIREYLRQTSGIRQEAEDGDIQAGSV